MRPCSASGTAGQGFPYVIVSYVSWNLRVCGAVTFDTEIRGANHHRPRTCHRMSKYGRPGNENLTFFSSFDIFILLIFTMNRPYISKNHSATIFNTLLRLLGC